MKSRANGFALGFLGTVSALVLCAPGAYAQDAEVGDVIVTANRREQALQDVAIAVSAVSASQLKEQNIVSLTDIKPGQIANVALVPFAGTPTVIAANIRGIGLSDPSQGTQELAVPIYIDGVFLGRAQGLGLDLIEPQRVEFLRGPQGQLFGRNAEGGAIQFVSRDPSGEFGFDVSAGLGSFEEERYRLRVDLPEIAGVSIQVAGTHREHEAYTQNGSTQVYAKQADYGLLDIDGYRVAALWEPADNFAVRYTYDNMDGLDNQPYLVWEPVANGAPQVSPEAPYSGENVPAQTYAPLYNTDFFVRAEGHALTLTWDLADSVTIKSITSYREAGRDGSSTLGGPLPAGASSFGFVHPNAAEVVDQNQSSQELQFLGSWERFDLTAGVVYYEEEVVDERRSLLTGPGLAPGAVFGGSQASLNACVGFDPCMTSHSEQNATTESLGIYAQGAYTPPILNDRLELTVGVRYSDDSKDATRTYIQPPIAPPVGGFTEATPSGPLPSAASFSAERWDPAVTVQYNWTDDLNTYVRYATAYRAGGANVRSSAFTSFAEEEVETWELGFKSQWYGRRFTLNGAIFTNTITGLQVNVQEAPTINPSLTNTVNLPFDVEITGAELEAFIRVTDGLTVNANLAYLDTDDYQVFDNPLTGAADPLRFYTLNSPEVSGSVGLTYTTQTMGVPEAVFHIDYTFAGDHWTTPGAIRDDLMPPAYSRPTTDVNSLNARVSLRNISLGNGVNGEIAIWGNNLLDEDRYIYAFDGGAFGGGFAEYLTPPLTGGIELRLSR